MKDEFITFVLIFNITFKTIFMNCDQIIFDLISEERERQSNGLELIASENFVSDQVMEAAGSILTNKYAEGYPGKRYYGGCEVVDEVEQLAIDRLCQLYDAEYTNVQPHSGAQANMAVFLTVLKPGDPTKTENTPTYVGTAACETTRSKASFCTAGSDPLSKSRLKTR